MRGADGWRLVVETLLYISRFRQFVKDALIRTHIALDEISTSSRISQASFGCAALRPHFWTPSSPDWFCGGVCGWPASANAMPEYGAGYV
jgi:hypothetical protein